MANCIKCGIELASGYRTETDNQPFLKGRLELAGHIKYNAAHRERFYVTYDVFDQDRAENRLIKTALAGVRKRTTSPNLRILAGRLLGDMDEIPFSQDPAGEFSRLVKDRSVARYGEVLEWARLFLLHESFTTFSGTGATQAVLFPMEQVFQDYVAAVLKRSLTPLGWEVSTQAQDDGRWFFYDKADKKDKFRLKPDLVLRKDNRCFVMDTKWKELDVEVRNAGISQDDLYQMYAYGKMYAADRVTLIYPLSKNGKEFTFISQEEKNLAKEKGPAKKENPVTVDVKQFCVDEIEEKLVDYVQGLLRNKASSVDGSPEG
ncbi:MAG: McrC family protein [Oscillospiraceae bacterium]|nr:McrC family protein [Oscillospiraceae bacterium]